jgi:hypothetical protein
MGNPTGRWRRLGIAGFVAVAIAGLCGSTPAWAQTAGKPTLSSFAIAPNDPGSVVTASPLVLYNTGGSVTVSAQVTDALTCTVSSTVGRVFDGSLTFSCSAGTVSVALDLPANSGRRSVRYRLRLTVEGYSTVTTKPIMVTVSKVPLPATT